MPESNVFSHPFVANLLLSDAKNQGLPRLSDLPKEERASLVATLEQLLADRSALVEYIGELQRYILQAKASGKLQGWHHNKLLPEEVEARVLNEGLQALGDNALAALALNMVALLNLHEELLRLMPEAWRPALARAGEVTARRHGIDLDKLLKSALERVDPTPAESPPAILTVPRWTERLHFRRLAPWLVAASVLVGFGVLFWMMSHPRLDKRRDAGLQLAASRPREGDVKPLTQDENTGAYRIKAGERLQLNIESKDRGYATVVLLGPDEILVRPRPGEPEIKVEGPTQYGPLDFTSGKIAVLVIVTPTPKRTDEIKALLPPAGASVDQAGEILSTIENGLLQGGIPWVAGKHAIVERVPEH